MLNYNYKKQPKITDLKNDGDFYFIKEKPAYSTLHLHDIVLYLFFKCNNNIETIKIIITKDILYNSKSFEKIRNHEKFKETIVVNDLEEMLKELKKISEKTPELKLSTNIGNIEIRTNLKEKFETQTHKPLPVNTMKSSKEEDLSILEFFSKSFNSMNNKNSPSHLNTKNFIYSSI